MKGNAAPFHQNFTTDKKNVSTEIVEKDIKKWVESVVEFKANMDKQKGDLPLEKKLKKIKKYNTKKKLSVVTMPIGGVKDSVSAHHKTIKSKKGVKKIANQPLAEKPRKKESTQPQAVDAFEMIKESYRNLKLPQNWTSGLSGNRVVFNRVRVTTQNAQQKMTVEKSLVITKDRNVHVLLNGSEITLTNWETQKVDTIDDVKRALKDIDLLKFCDGPASGMKSPQCSRLIDNKLKVCEACKSETTSPPKVVNKKPRTKKTGVAKGVQQQKSFQN